METRDIYIRHTGPDGKAFVQQHRVWDADRFMAARAADAVAANAKDKSTKAKVEVITKQQYMQERK